MARICDIGTFDFSCTPMFIEFMRPSARWEAQAWNL